MILLRASLRHLHRHPWQTALSVLGIALGVAVVVAIDLANASARRAFLLSAEGVAGRATHQVVGGPTGLDERVFTRLVREADAHPAAPVVDAWVAVASEPPRPLQLLGVDPFSEGPFRPYLGGAAGGPPGLARLLTEPGAVLLARRTAGELGVGVGDALELRVAARRRRVRVIGLLDPADARSREALSNVLVADVSTAQELLDQPGRLTRVDLIVPEGAAGDAALARARGVLPPGAALTPAGSGQGFVADVTRAFSVNLTALSLLALLVGVFLVYQTMTFAVVQRRGSIGLLRTLGVTRREVFGLVLLEGLTLGVVATGLGLGLGVGLARGLLRLVTRTINDLYFVVVVQDVAVTVPLLAKGAALGLGATLLAALLPAAEATAGPPGPALRRTTVEARARRAAPRAAAAGIAVLAAGAALVAAAERSLLLSYAGLFATAIGAALMTPLAVVAGGRLAAPVLGRLLGLPGRMAARGAVRALSRTGVAAAALVVAVAATVGVAIMIDSFRATVADWLDTSLSADVYVGAPGLTGARADVPLDPGLVARLASTPGVEAVGTHRAVRVDSAEGPTRLVVLDVASPDRARFRYLAGRPESAWAAFQGRDAVLVSEPYARRHRLAPGAAVALRTDRGMRRFPVAAVVAGYESDQGVVMMSRRTYRAHWDDPAVSSLALFAAPGTDVDTLVRTLRAAAGGEQELLIRSNRALRAGSMEVFDRTFAITSVLRLLTTVVAVIGVLSALMALQVERGRELAVLRAQGLTPREVGTLVVAETGLLGAIAGVLAVPVGIGLALVLVRVINERAFGWTIAFTVPPHALAQAVLLAVAAALAAGVVPAWRMARTSPAAALREE